MSFSNDQILNSLISFYASRGADMSYVLGDPIFRKLPIEDQVEAIKRHANLLHERTSTSLLPTEKRMILQDVVSNGILAGSTAMAVAGGVMKNNLLNAASRNKALGIMAASGLAIGGITGYMSGRMRTDSGVQARSSLKSELYRNAQNPSNHNALGVLAVNHLHSQNSEPRRDLTDKLTKFISGQMTGEDLKNRLQNNFDQTYASYHPT